MYEAHYGFTERPFSVQPDPAFLYFGPGHKMAFAMLEYGMMHRGGFTVITGEVGAGKTTLIRHLLTRIPEETKIGLITSTPRNETELLPRIMLAFDQPFEGISGIGLYKRFQEFLIDEYGKGGGAILIVDEAQNLGPERLEELRMLSNINSGKDQLLQLIIVGQPQLRDILQNPDMLQFCQRISADYHIRPLEQAETHAYIEHRLKVAGGNPRLFSTPAKQLIFQASGGIPRVINVICDTSLVYGFAMEAREIGTHIVQEVLADKRQHGISPIGDARMLATFGAGAPRPVPHQANASHGGVSRAPAVERPSPVRRTVDGQAPAVPGSAVQQPGLLVKLPLADKVPPAVLMPPDKPGLNSPVERPAPSPVRHTVDGQAPAVPGSAVQRPGLLVKLPLADKVPPAVLMPPDKPGLNSPVERPAPSPVRHTVDGQAPAVPGSAVQQPGLLVKLPLADKAPPAVLMPPDKPGLNSPVAKRIAATEPPSAASENSDNTAKHRPSPVKDWPVIEPDDKHAAPVRLAANEAKAFIPMNGRVRNHVSEKAEPVRRHRYGWLVAALTLVALVASLLGSDVSINGEAGSPVGSVLPASDASIDNEPASQHAQKFTQRLNPDGSEIDSGPARGPTIGEGTSISVSTRNQPIGR